MRTPVLPSRALIMLIAASAVALPVLPSQIAPASAQVSLSFGINYFQDRLSRYGSWMYHPRWGEVWRPRVSRDFRPYYNGRWEYTSDAGWLWLSADPWGEITEHYGRWVFDPRAGWMWVPGYVWGPSWVLWRQTDDYIGWFPMPPDYDEFDPYYYGPRYGADSWYGYRTWYPSLADNVFFSLWVFTGDRDFGRPGSRRYITDPGRVRDVYRRSVERTNYVNDRNRIVDRSIDVGRLERETNRRIEGQPARRFLANIPTTSVTEGRDISRRNRDAIRGPASRDNSGSDNQGRGNIGRDNLGGRDGNAERDRDRAGPQANIPRQRDDQENVERNRGTPPQGSDVQRSGDRDRDRDSDRERERDNNRRDRDDGQRTREQTSLPPQNAPQPTTPSAPAQLQDRDRGDRDDSRRGRDDDRRREREQTSLPPQNAPQPNAQGAPAQLQDRERGDNRSRPDTSRQERDGAAERERARDRQTEGRMRERGNNNAAVQNPTAAAQNPTAAPTPPAPKTETVAPAQDNETEDQNDRRRRGRERNAQ